MLDASSAGSSRKCNRLSLKIIRESPCATVSFDSALCDDSDGSDEVSGPGDDGAAAASAAAGAAAYVEVAAVAAADGASGRAGGAAAAAAAVDAAAYSDDHICATQIDNIPELCNALSPDSVTERALRNERGKRLHTPGSFTLFRCYSHNKGHEARGDRSNAEVKGAKRGKSARGCTYQRAGKRKDAREKGGEGAAGEGKILIGRTIFHWHLIRARAAFP